MNEIFSPHNLFKQSIELFKNEDPQLFRCRQSPYQFESTLIQTISNLSAGIYTLTGGRQVGKSTLAKQILLNLLCNKHFLPQNAIYMTGEVIPDHTSLLHHIDEFLQTVHDTAPGTMFIAIDEVTYIKEWHRAIKFLADAGRLRNVVLLLTGSDMVFLKEMAMQLPGRRGNETVVDFHYYPLSFLEFIHLRKILSPETIKRIVNNDTQLIDNADIATLYGETAVYLRTGGYLTALGDYAQHGTILPATLRTYTDWIRGDMLKRGKGEAYLKDILKAIVRKYGSQVTWNSFTGEVSVLHHTTIAEYCMALEAMDVLIIQHALREDQLEAAPKKAKKLSFTDPFISRAVAEYAGEALVSDAQLIEAAVIHHSRRKYPTYYIKNDAEIDCAYIHENRFYPIEVKWTQSVKPEHFNMLKRYPGSILAAKVTSETTVGSVKVVPVPFLLLRLSQ